MAAAGIEPGDLVLDVGAGRGALTRPLVAQGARVVAIEAHPKRWRDLRAEFASSARVVRADATDLRLPHQAFKVVANPPFSAVTALVRRLLSPNSRLASAHLVVPRHAVRRWTAASAPGRARWSEHFATFVGPRLPPAAFSPPPPKAPQILVIRRLEQGRPRGSAP